MTTDPRTDWIQPPDEPTDMEPGIPNPHTGVLTCPNNAGRSFREQYRVGFTLNPGDNDPTPAARFDSYGEAIDFALRWAGEQQGRTVHGFWIDRLYVRADY